MSGTEVTINLGQVLDFFGINALVVKPSVLDKFNSEGLCGTLNDDKLDDLMPQNGNTPYVMKAKWGIIEPLGKSWRYIYTAFSHEVYFYFNIMHVAFS
jgi:hypothetical protein